MPPSSKTKLDALIAEAKAKGLDLYSMADIQKSLKNGAARNPDDARRFKDVMGTDGKVYTINSFDIVGKPIYSHPVAAPAKAARTSRPRRKPAPDAVPADPAVRASRPRKKPVPAADAPVPAAKPRKSAQALPPDPAFVSSDSAAAAEKAAQEAEAKMGRVVSRVFSTSKLLKATPAELRAMTPEQIAALVEKDLSALSTASKIDAVYARKFGVPGLKTAGVRTGIVADVSTHYSLRVLEYFNFLQEKLVLAASIKNPETQGWSKAREVLGGLYQVVSRQLYEPMLGLQIQKLGEDFLQASKAFAKTQKMYPLDARSISRCEKQFTEALKSGETEVPNFIKELSDADPWKAFFKKQWSDALESLKPIRLSMNVLELAATKGYVFKNLNELISEAGKKLGMGADEAARMAADLSKNPSGLLKKAGSVVKTALFIAAAAYVIRLFSSDYSIPTTIEKDCADVSDWVKNLFGD